MVDISLCRRKLRIRLSTTSRYTIISKSTKWPSSWIENSYVSKHGSLSPGVAEWLRTLTDLVYGVTGFKPHPKSQAEIWSRYPSNRWGTPRARL